MEKAQKRKEETQKWRELPIGVWYRIKSEHEVNTRNGPDKILMLDTWDVDIVRVWSCTTLLTKGDCWR